MQNSLSAISNGTGGLDAHRESMLRRVPNPGDWARFSYEHLVMNDLAYLTAQTGHEFAILRGKREDILFHGTHRQCLFADILVEKLLDGKLRLFGHSHPGEPIPIPSVADRDFLSLIGQNESRLISGYSGREIVFTSDPFEIL